MTLWRGFDSLARELIDREIDKGGLAGYTDRELETAQQVVAEDLEEAWREALYQLRQAEPTFCKTGRCGTCDGCVWKGDREYHERKEAA